MLFNSLHFLIFFPIVTALYFLLPNPARWWMLLLASCCFYMALIPKYIVILCFLIAVDYTAGLLIENAPQPRRRWLLMVSLAANLGMLGFFKYFNFLNANVGAFWDAFLGHWTLHSLRIILPLGLSFHTFQSISYTIEVYRGRVPAERHLGRYALYVLFYPQLVAGPIERPYNLLHQLWVRHEFDYERVADGLKLMAWGMFKKVVIADRLAAAVAMVYGDPTKYTGWPLIYATWLFSIQIFCDFSGYSDIAIGAARVMGVRLMDNFNMPYLATSVADFWHRWHISLSTWFRDYLYVPMGGSRVSRGRWYYNLMVVFVVSGLWHGANWTFVIWGGLHGAYMVFSRWTADFRSRLARAIPVMVPPALKRAFLVVATFNLVSFAWIFFRARSLADALYIVRHLFVFQPASVQILAPFDVSVILVGTAFLALGYSALRSRAWVRWPAYYLLLYSILLVGKFANQQFIYFQF